MTAPAISSSNTPATTAGYVDSSLPQESTPIRDESTFTQTNSSPVLPKQKLPAFAPKKVVFAGLWGIASGGFFFGMIANCTVLGGVAGAILGLSACGLGNYALRRAIITLIGAFKEPGNPNYATDFINKNFAQIFDFAENYPMYYLIYLAIDVALLTALLFSLMALGGTQGIILGLALAMAAFSLDYLLIFLLNYLSNHHPTLFHHQQQLS